MRIKVLFEGTEVQTIDKDYRSYFISFLKMVFERSNLYHEVFSKKKYRPYAFSPYLGEDFRIEEDKIQIGKNLSILFASGDPVIITNFYNGVLKLKNEGIKLWNKDIKVKDIELLPYRKIKSTRVLFKTMGICVLSDKRVSAKDFENFYIIPSDDLSRFNICLYERTNERFRYLTKNNEIHPIRITYLKEVKEVVVKHYNGYVRGFKGIFEVEGSPEILQFVYDFGFGVRTGQGFGLLEILEEL